MSTDTTTPTVERIWITVDIENAYADGVTIWTAATATVPPPPAELDDVIEWEREHLYPLTGAGRDGYAVHEVTVVTSSRPDLLPVGTTVEFG
jgi:hypothetical protein